MRKPSQPEKQKLEAVAPPEQQVSVQFTPSLPEGAQVTYPQPPLRLEDVAPPVDVELSSSDMGFVDERTLTKDEWYKAHGFPGAPPDEAREWMGAPLGPVKLAEYPVAEAIRAYIDRLVIEALS